MEQGELKEIDYWKELAELMGESFVRYVKTKGQLENDLENAKNYYQKLIGLKVYYESNKTEILQTYRQSKHLWFSVYPTDWSKLLQK